MHIELSASHMHGYIIYTNVVQLPHSSFLFAIIGIVDARNNVQQIASTGLDGVNPFDYLRRTELIFQFCDTTRNEMQPCTYLFRQLEVRRYKLE